MEIDPRLVLLRSSDLVSRGAYANADGGLFVHVGSFSIELWENVVVLSFEFRCLETWSTLVLYEDPEGNVTGTSGWRRIA